MQTSKTKVLDRGQRCLTINEAAPDGVIWVYGLGTFFQLEPGVVAMLVNVRRGGVMATDLESGVDVIVFNRLEGLAEAERMILSRGDHQRLPDGREVELSIYPCKGGFVPLGSGRAGEGTGFGMSAVRGYPGLDTKPSDIRNMKDPYYRLRLYQFSYNGTRFSVDEEVEMDPRDLCEGYFVSPGLKPAVMDGDDMLFPLAVRRTIAMGAKAGSDSQEEVFGEIAISRWQYRDGKWVLAAFDKVPEANGCMEPTLIRLPDGGLLLNARGMHGTDHAYDIQLWRSDDGGKSWSLWVERKDCRSASTTTVGITASGVPFVLANLREPGRKAARYQLALFEIDVEKRVVLDPQIIRDCPQEFGLWDGEFHWWADHAIAEVVTLADGKKHCLMSYRVVNELEIARDLTPTPVTGNYVGEIE